MSTTSTPDAGTSTPLTRRQRRDLERAQEIAQQAQQDARVGAAPGAAAAVSAASAGRTVEYAARTEHLPALQRSSAEGHQAPHWPASDPSTVEPAAVWRAATVSSPAPHIVTSPQEEPRFLHPTGDDAVTPLGLDAGGDLESASDGTAEAMDDAADGAVDDVEVPRPRRTLGGPLGRMPRGPLAVALIGVVVLAMILVPLAVNKLIAGRNGSGVSTVGQSTVQDGNAPLDQVLKVSGRVGSGSAPSVTLTNEASLSAPHSVITDVVVTGEGRVVADGSPVILQVSRFSGLDARNTTGKANGYNLWKGTLGASEVGSEVDAAVSGQHEGSRVVLRAPTEEKDGTRTAEITVVDILPTTATGEAQDPGGGAPAVAEGPDGSVTVSSAGLPTPTRAATAVLIKGTGPQVGPQDKLIARSTMVSWVTGQELDESSYGHQKLPKLLDMSNALVGVSQNLVDIRSGSRVVLSLPAEQAQGNEPVVVVIDILAIDPSSSDQPKGSVTAAPLPSSSPQPTNQDKS